MEEDEQVIDSTSNGKYLREILAKKITFYRKLKDMSRAELGGKIGVTEASIGQYERGERLPSVEILYQLSKIFKVPIDTLVADYNPTWWADVQLFEKAGFRVEKSHKDFVDIYAEPAPPQEFTDYKSFLQFQGWEREIYYSYNEEFVTFFNDTEEFQNFADFLRTIFFNALGVKYYINKLLLEFAQTGTITVPELIFLTRSDVARQSLEKRLQKK
ncbi:MAG: helix-turn-helix transcriptional regulator [Selenomonadaceae bacterium]|nr:helix-turn-helix transcriptional regulator [Selenomonadaceae bacterium]MBR0288280.1 helix-turn-helix transcriptional regulator [Selenomonadaceae bacterium]